MHIVHEYTTHPSDANADPPVRAYPTRLGMNSVDLLVIHDLDLMHMTEQQAEAHFSVLVTSGYPPPPPLPPLPATYPAHLTFPI